MLREVGYIPHSHEERLSIPVIVEGVRSGRSRRNVLPHEEEIAHRVGGNAKVEKMVGLVVGGLRVDGPAGFTFELPVNGTLGIQHGFHGHRHSTWGSKLPGGVDRGAQRICESATRLMC